MITQCDGGSSPSLASSETHAHNHITVLKYTLLNRSERGEMKSHNKVLQQVSVQMTQKRFTTKMKFNDPLLDE